MEKKIPLYFDTVAVSSPIQNISDRIARMNVRVFTKYGNRNGSYITDAVAIQLIESATKGNVPVVGFFDPSSKTWASHTGPALANAYGYVENFIGWEPFTDTDNVTRDYAVFSVVLFTDYFEEANKILGQNQSMELDPTSIQGDWAEIEDNEYFVYTTAKMLGFCIIGEHEPCFSVSAFFSKNDDTYNNQFEKFSSLLFDLKAKVEEAEKGGEQPMNELENQEVVDNTVTPEVKEPENFEKNEEPENQEPVVNEEPTQQEPEINSEFAALQQQYDELQTSYNELQEKYNAAQAQLEEMNTFQTNANQELETLRVQVSQLQTSLQTYEAAAITAENEKKEQLIASYEKILDEEEITPIKEGANDYSYDELESKLAIVFAHKQMNSEKKEEKVPVLEPEKSQFALLMEKYRKN